MPIKNGQLTRITAALVLAGVGSAMRNVVQPLFLTGDLRMTVAGFGLFGATTMAASIVVNLVVGRLSDGIARRQGLIALVALWVSAGYVLSATRPSIVMLFVVGAASFSMITVPIGQLFATGADNIRTRGYPRPAMLMGALRASLSVGFAFGPILAAAASAWAGLRWGMFWIGMAWLAVALVLVPDLVESRRAARSASARGTWERSILLVFVAFSLISLVDVARSGFMVIFAHSALGMPITSAGMLFSVTAVLNIVMMPLAGAVADRIGARLVVIIGAGVGAIAAVGMAFASSAAVLVICGAAHSIYTASVYSVGLAFAHDLAAGRPGFGIGVYNGALQLGGLLGLLLGGLVADRIGWRALFALSAGGCVCGLALLACIDSNRRGIDNRPRREDA